MRGVRKVLRHWLEPVPLDSEKAAKARADWDQEQEWRRQAAENDKAKKPLDPPPVERIRSLLDKVDQGDTDAWWQISHWSEVKEDGRYANKSYKIDLRELPGWQNAGEVERRRMVEAAHRYLLNHKGDANEWFAQPDREHRTMIAGLRALLLLANDNAELFDSLPYETWQRWVPAVVRRTAFEETECYQRLLSAAVCRVPKQATAEILCAIDSESHEGETLWVLHKLEKQFHSAIGSELLIRLQSRPALRPACAVQLLARCIDAKIPRALELARRWLPKKPVFQKRKRILALEAAHLLMQHGDGNDWPAIRRLIDKDVDFGKRVFARFANGHYRAVPALLQKTTPHDVGRIWEWTLVQYPTEEDPDRSQGGTVTARWAIAELRDGLVSSLADRGTAEACEELEHLRAKYPMLTWLRWVIARAREQTRRNTWTPVTPAELFALASQRGSRIVQSADQLIEVICDALSELQSKLHAETPAAQFLWNDDCPKEEEAISDWVKIELDSLLVSRGVVINREVQIHIRERTDIHVDAVTRATATIEARRIKVIIEVKGCWNPDQKGAVESQLVNRYLAQNDCTHGMFLLAWFVCSRWNNKDRRRGKVPFATKQMAQRYFDAEAKRLSDDRIRIESILLDVTVPSRRRKVSRRW